MTRQFELHPEDRLHCSRLDLAASLPHWAELESARKVELQTHADDCPRCGPALALLSSVDSWLDEQINATASDDCPGSEELYSFGRGPGAEALPDERYAAIADHVATCAHCETLTESLIGQPPSPLVIDPPTPEPEQAPVGRPTSLRLLGTLAAAAASIAAAAFLFTETRAASPQITYPGAPLLRGESAGHLHFPRESVLAYPEGGLHSEMVFEIAPQPEASGYAVYLESQTGGALDRGERLATLRGEAPVLFLPAEQRAALRPGRYTWEAWAVVNGLDEPLGRRDFEIVLDPGILARVERLQGRPEPERSEATLALLHATYPSDARAFARTLPASPEREAYLARAPGR